MITKSKLQKEIGNIIKRIRWKIFYFFKKDKDNGDNHNNTDNPNNINKFGFALMKCRPLRNDFIDFENVLTNIMKNLEIIKFNNNFKKEKKNT